MTLPTSAIAALQAGNKIEAIKAVRESSGLGLKEAKDTVEAYLKQHPELAARIRQSGGGSLVSWAFMMIVAIAAIVYFWPRS